MESARSLLIKLLDRRIVRLRLARRRLHDRHLEDRLLDQALARLVRIRDRTSALGQPDLSAQRAIIREGSANHGNN